MMGKLVLTARGRRVELFLFVSAGCGVLVFSAFIAEVLWR